MIWQPPNLSMTCPVNSNVSSCSPSAYVYLNLLVQLFGGSKDLRIQDRLREHEEDEYDREEFDFIVVGAGSAGCVVANRLSAKRKWKVLLLEAGGEQPDVTLVPALWSSLLGSNLDWNYSTEPDGQACLAFPGGRCTWAKGKVMGGSSSINTMVYARGNRLDYDEWEALGNEGWSYKDVLPFFIKSERNLDIEGRNRKYHGVHGEQSISRYPYIDRTAIMIIDAFHERGLPLTDFNGAHQQGTALAQAISENGERVSTNNAFIQPIRYRRKNLTVRIESEVVKILINKNNVAYGVKYIRKGKIHTVFAKKEVIISGGSINSPKLLMLSGIGPREHLSSLNIAVKQDLPVGENLHDHIRFIGPIVGLHKQLTTRVNHQELIEEVYNYNNMEIKNGPLSANGPINIGVFLKSDPNLPAPDIQIMLRNVLYNDTIREPATAESSSVYPTSFYDSVSGLILNVTPKSRGKLLLNPENPHGQVLIYANYLGDLTDLIPSVKGTQAFLELENTKTFRDNEAHFIKEPLPACRDHIWGSEEYIVCLIRNYTSTMFHPVGTCRMGPRWVGNAVVDSRLRVHGISRLRVIDASIMPKIVRGNPHGATMMIGEKGAHLVYEDWRN